MAEVEKARTDGDFDLVRRGAVFPTSDQAASLMAIFEPKPPAELPKAVTGAQPSPSAGPPALPGQNPEPGGKAALPIGPTEPMILTEQDAVYELRAVPLYFPTSFALVKPYVDGFETNSLDAITLANVAIDSNWRPQSAGQ